jgi:hypothetical protein
MNWTYETLVDWVQKHPAPKDEELTFEELE